MNPLYLHFGPIVMPALAISDSHFHFGTGEQGRVAVEVMQAGGRGTGEGIHEIAVQQGLLPLKQTS